MDTDLILNIVRKNKAGKKTGIFSVCSANKFVLKAALGFAKKNDIPILIEATSNQVDQFGGYTGMTPRDFTNYVETLAREIGYSVEKIIFGGDHLGPNVWQSESEKSAMEKAKTQIAEYVKAGFTKIHLDASMALKGDKRNKGNGLLDAELVARRSAELCEIAEKTAKETGVKPTYIIGTDVPIPGGAIETENDIRITPPDELLETVETTRRIFASKNLEDAWERVAAVVVQPGVEFSVSRVFEYDSAKTVSLRKTLAKYDTLVFEAHSTDYQRANKLAEMVKDNFAILKVGPWLTFALREALFGLELIERELFDDNALSHLRETLEKEMLANPKHWEKHYGGSEQEQKLARAFGYSDRIRYYWNNKNVVHAVDKLLENLSSTEIPITLVSQYFPRQYDEIRNGEIVLSARSLIESKIDEVLTIYKNAVGDYR
jgi:D-tagatose-1,6-bisphosphate aldolase subunit GatZ/KbaZ